MAGYADLDAVKYQLRVNDTDELDAQQIARIEQLDDSLSRVFDAKVGRTWGAGATVTRSFEASIVSNVIVLLTPVRSVSAITAGGTWDGTTWIEPDEIEIDRWILSGQDAQGNFHQIKAMAWAVWPGSLSGVNWTGPVHVTGVWADDPGGAVPADVRDALTWLVIHHFREEFASPAGQIGPDGMIVQTRNPWTYERVAQAIKTHRVQKVPVF